MAVVFSITANHTEKKGHLTTSDHSAPVLGVAIHYPTSMINMRHHYPMRLI